MWLGAKISLANRFIALLNPKFSQACTLSCTFSEITPNQKFLNTFFDIITLQLYYNHMLKTLLLYTNPPSPKRNRK